jgi:hypothetical protein
MSSTDFVEQIKTEDSTPLFNQIAAVASKTLFISPSSSPFPNTNVRVGTLDTQQSFTVNALLDSGATGLYVDKRWVLKHGIQTTPLRYPQRVYNADGTPNAQGEITHQVQLRIAVQGHLQGMVPRR